MTAEQEPDHTAVRVALWRARHVELDAAPPVLDDTVGLGLVDPPGDWRTRPDMDPEATRGLRAAVVARARFLDDLVAEHAARGVGQYVVLGAGLDTLAQRRPDLVDRLRVFEIEQPGTQAWKRRRLEALGYAIPDGLRFVPVDLEAAAARSGAGAAAPEAERGAWWDHLLAAGFDPARPALLAAAGLTMYLRRETNRALLATAAALAPGSTVAVTFLLPPDLLDPADRPGLHTSTRGAAASGTPFVSLYTPAEMLAAAREAGFREVGHVAGPELAARYFAGRADGLRPSTGEDVLLATV